MRNITTRGTEAHRWPATRREPLHRWLVPEAGRVLGRPDGPGLRRTHTEMIEDLLADVGLEDDRDEVHRATASIAAKNVDREHATEKLSPGNPGRRSAGAGWGMSGARDDGRAITVSGTEDAMISRQVFPRWRNQDRELSQKLHRREGEL